jgi:hypothetical protein
MSIVISASSAIVESEITAGVVAVVDDFSEASIESFVERMEFPPSLMSTIIVEPTDAVVTLARTAVRVIAHGARNVTLAVPVVSAVVSSDAARPISIGTLLSSAIVPVLSGKVIVLAIVDDNARVVDTAPSVIITDPLFCNSKSAVESTLISWSCECAVRLPISCTVPEIG